MGGMAKKKHEKGAGSTPATVQLEKAGVPFKTYEYAHSNDHMDDGYGVEAATKLGFDEHQVFKTLMADTGSERVVGVVPVSGHMDLKALAAAVGAKKAAMADPKVAMRESGYVVGGISPLGGTGLLLGTFAGAAVWQTLENGLNMIGAQVGIQRLVIGIIVVFSVLLDVVVRSGNFGKKATK